MIKRAQDSRSRLKSSGEFKPVISILDKTDNLVNTIRFLQLDEAASLVVSYVLADINYSGNGLRINKKSDSGSLLKKVVDDALLSIRGTLTAGENHE
jgi:hypothetical protein